jgi:hypothetical protein
MCFSGDKQSNLRLFWAGELPTKTSVDGILDLFNLKITSFFDGIPRKMSSKLNGIPRKNELKI